MTDADYLSLLTRKMFHSGFSKETVDRKWPGFEAAFHRFAPERVATLSVLELEHLYGDQRLVRHRAKIRAVVANARHFQEVAGTHGSWGTWLGGLGDHPYEERANTLQACLTHCGPTTIFYFLLEAGEVDLDDKPDNVR